MNKLSIKSIIDFRKKSDRRKKTFAQNLQIEKEKKETDGGGDYWVICLSAISNAFKHNDNSIIIDKIHEFEAKYENTDLKRTKDMYERNIAILYKYEDYDFSRWIPKVNFQTIKKHRPDFLLNIKGLQVEALPHHVFTFQDENKEIGAIWFIAQLDGYERDELAMFTDILHRYLELNFSKKYIINAEFCIAVDVVNQIEISYAQILKDNIPLKLNSTLEEIRKLM
ncbi:hypothetical protein [Carboxylicivirga taeanensis]|uniref:hypothetical protein n=1 Tax=Carboxylicivirga taeanensis TaxID=1416875 RepID=UPI003F6E43F3